MEKEPLDRVFCFYLAPLNLLSFLPPVHSVRFLASFVMLPIVILWILVFFLPVVLLVVVLSMWEATRPEP